MSTKIGLSACQAKERRFRQALQNPMIRKLSFTIMQIKGLSYYKDEPSLQKVEELEEKDYDDETDSCKDDQASDESSNENNDKLNLTTELFERIENNSTEEVPDEECAPMVLPLMVHFPILSHKTQFY